MRAALLLAIVAACVPSSVRAQSALREVLPSGLTVIIDEFHATAAVEVLVAVRAGPLHEGPLLGSGVSALTQRLVVGGGGADERRRALARLGNHFAAGTQTAYASYALSTTGDKCADALALLAGMLANYAWNQVDLERERRGLIAAGDDPALVEERLLGATLYRAHPARLPVAGLPRMVDQLTVDLVKRYQAARYTTANTVVVVVGNVNTNEARRWVEQAFSRHSLGGYQAQAPVVEPAQVAPRHASGVVPGAAPRTLLAWRTEPPEHPAQPALAVLAQALGGRRGVLGRALAGRQLAVEVAVENRLAVDQPGALVIALDTAPERRAEIEPVLADALAALAQNGPGDDELAMAKRHLRRIDAERQAAVRPRSQDLLHWELCTADPAFGRSFANQVAAVTKAEVAEAARRYLVADGQNRRCTVVMRAQAEPPGAASRTAAPTGTLKPELVTLPGGLRLLLRPAGEQPLAHLRLTLGGGAAVEPAEQAGATALLAQLLVRSTVNRTVADIDALLASRGMELSAEAGLHALALGVTCFPEDVDAALELLLDLLCRPALAQDDLEAARARLQRELAGREADAELRLLAHARAVALPGHYAARAPAGRADGIARLDRAALAAHFRRLAVSGNAVLSCYGPIERDAVVASVQRLLSRAGGLPAGAALRPPPPPAQGGPPPPLTVAQQAGPRAGVVLAWGAPPLGARGNDDAAMAVLGALLAGGNGRLERALAAVAPELALRSAHESYDSRGLWLAWTRCDDAHVDLVQQVVREQVRGLLGELALPAGDPRALAPAELDIAKALAATARTLAQEDQAGEARRHAETLLASADGAAEIEAVARLAAVTLADVQRVAAAWLAGEPAVIVHRPPAVPAPGAGLPGGNGATVAGPTAIPRMASPMQSAGAAAVPTAVAAPAR